jgi:hypothetical protein
MHSGFWGVGVDRIHGAERVDQGGAGVHGHGHTESFGDFLFGGASFEGSIGVESDATIAARGDGNGDGDKLADLLAEERVLGTGARQRLVALERVGSELGEFGDGFRKFSLLGVPIEEHVRVPPESG